MLTSEEVSLVRVYIETLKEAPNPEYTLTAEKQEWLATKLLEINDECAMAYVTCEQNHS